MKYSYTNPQKLFFYVTLFLDKLSIPFTISKGKLSLLIAEILWTFRPFTKISPSFTSKIFQEYYEIPYGKFKINPDLQSVITLSPAFENNDIKYLIKLLKLEMKKKSRILFIDVGAHIGLYTIVVGKLFKRYKSAKIIAFEPNANNFLGDNYRNLKENIKLNNIKNITVHKTGLGKETTLKNNKFGIKTKAFDDIYQSSFAKKYDVIFLKIDIEGHEKNALIGLSRFLQDSKKTFLLIEDCVDNRIVNYLQKNNFTFIHKSTPYNSFWVKD